MTAGDDRKGIDMTCAATMAAIEAFLEGEAAAESLAPAERHARGCKACAGELAAARRLARAIESSLDVSIPADGPARVLAALSLEGTPSNHARRPVELESARLVAAGSGAAVLATASRNGSRPHARAPEPLVTARRHGGQSTLRLRPLLGLAASIVIAAGIGVRQRGGDLVAARSAGLFNGSRSSEVPPKIYDESIPTKTTDVGVIHATNSMGAGRTTAGTRKPIAATVWEASGSSDLSALPLAVSAGTDGAPGIPIKIELGGELVVISVPPEVSFVDAGADVWIGPGTTRGTFGDYATYTSSAQGAQYGAGDALTPGGVPSSLAGTTVLEAPARPDGTIDGGGITFHAPVEIAGRNPARREATRGLAKVEWNGQELSPEDAKKLYRALGLAPNYATARAPRGAAEERLLSAKAALEAATKAAGQSAKAAEGSAARIAELTSAEEALAKELAEIADRRQELAKKAAVVASKKPVLEPIRLAEIASGELLAREADGALAGPFPLKHTDIHAEVSGALASTLVEQHFENPFPRKIEAIYCFPLPHTAAVNEFVMQIGDRTVHGVIREREEARRVYAEAKARGQVASLLEADRPSVFLESIANVEPAREIDVKIRYFHVVECEGGVFRYVFPMVMGHRYGDAEGRRSPPRLEPDSRSGHDIAVEVDIDAGATLRDVRSPSHDVSVEPRSDTRSVVRLSPRDSVPNRDFILEWRAGAELDTSFGVIAHAGDDGKFFTLVAEPPLVARDADYVPREIFFLVDASGSMAGKPIEQAKRFVRRAIAGLRADDVFDIATFASATKTMSQELLSPESANQARAMGFVDEIHADGGTECEDGLRLALEHPRDPGRVRIVVVLTDGGVDDEAKVLERVERSSAGARVFAFGVGSAPNRGLLDRLAEIGRGTAEYVLPEEPEDAVARRIDALYERLDAPVLVDATIDWGGLPVEDVLPKRVPDLFAGRPLVLFGRYTRGSSGTVKVSGIAGKRRFEREVAVTLPDREPAHAALGAVFARAKVEELSKRALAMRAEGEKLLAAPLSVEEAGLPPEAQAKLREARGSEHFEAAKRLEKEMRALALDFSLATPFTSFVAVDSDSETGTDEAVEIRQPVEVPKDANPGVFRDARGREVPK